MSVVHVSPSKNGSHSSLHLEVCPYDEVKGKSLQGGIVEYSEFKHLYAFCDRNPVTSFTTGMQERTRTFPDCNNKLQMDYLREQMMVIYFVNKMSVIEIVKDKSATYPFVTRTFRKVVSPDTFYRKIQQQYGLLLDKECRFLLRCVQRV
jgi:hypothetical protein